jgi:excinuclease ABC subunit C
MIHSVCLFLEGRSDAVASNLRKQMEQAAEELQFEKAAQLRDQLAAVEKVTEKQNIVTGSGDQDVLGLARSAFGACVQVLFIRAGKMVGQERFMLSGSEQEEDSAVLAAFIQQYYSRASFIPREILLPFPLAEHELINSWLNEQKAGKVELVTPKRGTKKDLLAMAAGNAAEALAQQEAKAESQEAKTTGAVAELGRLLGFGRDPVRIECFDISHIQGAETVASMVVFENGEPKKADYRRFKLRTVEGKPDDFRSMQEVVSRRYIDADPDGLPDLVIIDGGKGQLNAALAIIRGAGCTMPVVGLAKEFEHIFREGESDPVILPRHSQALYLVQRVRDEAHRFAITYHRKLRAKRNMVSVLDHVPGIGPKRRKALWDHFGSLAKIKAATVEELADAPGMTVPAAEAVYRFFRTVGKV